MPGVPIYRKRASIAEIVDRATERYAQALEAVAVEALKIDPEPSNWHWKVSHDGKHTLVHAPLPPVGYVYPDNGEFRR